MCKIFGRFCGAVGPVYPDYSLPWELIPRIGYLIEYYG
jgi:hypothetical protein